MKNIYIPLIICLTFLCIPSGFSQLDPVIYQFAQNRLLLNPAYAGFENTTRVAVLHNLLLPKILDAQTSKNLSPRNTALGIGVPIPNFITGKKGDFAGASFSYIHRKAGYETFEAYRLGLSKHIALGDSSSLRIGAEFQLQELGIEFIRLNPSDTLDPAVPYFAASDRNKNCNLGLFYSSKNWNAFYFGLSMTQVFAARFSYTTPGGQVFNIRNSRQFYMISGMMFTNIFHLASLDFSAALLVKGVGFNNRLVNNIASLQTSFSYKNLLEFGGIFHYHLSDSKAPRPGILIGLNLGKIILPESRSGLRIGYSLQPYIINSLISHQKKYFHEISLNYSIKMD